MKKTYGYCEFGVVLFCVFNCSFFCQAGNLYDYDLSNAKLKEEYEVSRFALNKYLKKTESKSSAEVAIVKDVFKVGYEIDGFVGKGGVVCRVDIFDMNSGLQGELWVNPVDKKVEFVNGVWGDKSSFLKRVDYSLSCSKDVLAAISENILNCKNIKIGLVLRRAVADRKNSVPVRKYLSDSLYNIASGLMYERYYPSRYYFENNVECFSLNSSGDVVVCVSYMIDGFYRIIAETPEGIVYAGTTQKNESNGFGLFPVNDVYKKGFSVISMKKDGDVGIVEFVALEDRLKKGKKKESCCLFTDSSFYYFFSNNFKKKSSD